MLAFVVGPYECAIILLLTGVLIVPFWRIFPKAGFSTWLCLLMLIPLVNLLMLYFLAFASWPVLRSNLERQQRSARQ